MEGVTKAWLIIYIHFARGGNIFCALHIQCHTKERITFLIPVMVVSFLVALAKLQKLTISFAITLRHVIPFVCVTNVREGSVVNQHN